MKCEWIFFHLRMNLKTQSIFFDAMEKAVQFPLHLYAKKLREKKIYKEKRNQVSSELIFGKTGETFQFSIDYGIHKKTSKRRNSIFSIFKFNIVSQVKTKLLKYRMRN